MTEVKQYSFATITDSGKDHQCIHLMHLMHPLKPFWKTKTQYLLNLGSSSYLGVCCILSTLYTSEVHYTLERK